MSWLPLRTPLSKPLASPFRSGRDRARDQEARPAGGGGDMLSAADLERVTGGLDTPWFPDDDWPGIAR